MKYENISITTLTTLNKLEFISLVRILFLFFLIFFPSCGDFTEISLMMMMMMMMMILPPTRNINYVLYICEEEMCRIINRMTGVIWDLSFFSNKTKKNLVVHFLGWFWKVLSLSEWKYYSLYGLLIYIFYGYTLFLLNRKTVRVCQTNWIPLLMIQMYRIDEWMEWNFDKCMTNLELIDV